ncbi:MAG: quinolinate synthase NadA [Prolixibacteraceae bacterium]|nr:quinolinate synthase NadA [Prolixibacteraceae bacterium]
MDNTEIQKQLKEKGYISEPINPALDLEKEIRRLKKEKKAVILSHFYVDGELQDIADFVGDSLQLAKEAEKTKADIIVFVGVHFMAETAKIINPGKKVLLPDLNASCSLDESAPYEKFCEFKKNYPDHKVISYINCSAALKTLTDVVCTSSNALKIVESFPEDEKIIFAPDKNLGNYINELTGRNMVLWDGSCMVHANYSYKKISLLMQKYEDAEVIAHPECEKRVLSLAKHIGSTASLLVYVQKSPVKRFIIATEIGIIHQMKKVCPDKIFIPAPCNDSPDACNSCTYMKLNTMAKLYNCLKYELPEVKLSDEVINKARKSIVRMLEISK